ncbi:hypothetical protein ACFO9Q_01450 [Paenibacillus sp. GCM10023252]|uniref:hypothetical protein n=1 Tax=Paenibacillus sp. GCM10023252 TaxID=3252649 RepID=UPI00360F4AA2
MDADWERLLRKSLASVAEPEEKLNESIIYQLKERSQTNYKYRKGLSAGLLAAVLLLVLSVSAYAATQLFSAQLVVEHLGDQMLADAFESKDAIQINQTKASGDYRFTLHGLVSGAGLSKFHRKDVYPDRTYAVVSISTQDGRPMPSTHDPEYGKAPFFVTPLIKGLKPWQFNIASMKGAYSETVIDGVMYRLIECDQVEMFADKGVYLAISGTTFYSIKAFSYDENTGEIHAREDYPGAAVLFDLPLDVTKADPAKAEAYLKTLLRSSSSQSHVEEEEWVNWMKDLRAKIRNGETIGETIPQSIKEVTYDNSGNITYTYDSWNLTTSPEDLFEEGEIGFSDRRLPISGGSDDIYRALLLHRDENGVITGRIVSLDQGYPQ